MRYEARAVAWSSGLDSDEPTVNWCVVKVCVSRVLGAYFHYSPSAVMRRVRVEFVELCGDDVV